MGDSISRIFMIFFGCIILFIAPITLVAIKQDTVKQSYIDNAVKDFTDNVRAAGKITPEAYEKLCYNVDSAHLLCDIEIVHSSVYTVPVGAKDPVTGYYEVATYMAAYDKGDILAVMYPDSGDDRDYIMKNGDYISVRVMNTTPTLGVRLLRALQLHPGDLSIYSSYGGAVGNNIQ